MRKFGRLSLAVAIFAALAATSVGWAFAATPVLIKQCIVLKPKPLSHNANGTQIEYVIYGHKTVSSITFAVGYRNAAQHFLRTVTDVGTFSPGVTINHRFALYNDVTYAGAPTSSCMPVRVKYSDATLWIAPH